MSTKIIYGKYLIANTETVIPSGALFVKDDTIIDVGSYTEITAKYEADEVLGSSDYLVTPGFVNAHSHGKGITDFQRGSIDDTLEIWRLRGYPPVDIYYDTLWTSIRLLESGVTTTMHNHNHKRVGFEEHYEEFCTTICAYCDAGLRVAFAPPLTNQNIFVYGDDAEFVRSLPTHLREFAEGIVDQMELFGEKEYFQAVNDLRNDFRSPRVQIMHGPIAPQWCQDDSLQHINRHATQHGMRIHIHTLQTPLQKLYGFRRYGKSLLEHLAEIGFLGEHVTCGHCVWLTESDIDLLAETGTSVTHHASCNLRIRNGISPVFALLEKNVIVAIGMDDKQLGDDNDFLEEMRLVSKLHRLPSHHLESKHLVPTDCFKMGTLNGAQVLGFSHLVGSLEKGKQADVVLVDLRRMSEPFTYPEHDVIDLLVYRGRSIDVDTVLVAGEVVLRNGTVTKIDKQEVIAKLQESLPRTYSDEFKHNSEKLNGLKKKIAEHYSDWYGDLEKIEMSPYYLMNNRR